MFLVADGNLHPAGQISYVESLVLAEPVIVPPEAA